MKTSLKLVALAFFISFAANNVLAQGFYLKVGGGYNFGAGKTSMVPQLFEEHRNTDGSFTKRDISISLGQGVNTLIGGGYMFNEYIGVELSANYLIGTNITVNSTAKNDYGDGIASEESIIKINSSELLVSPAIKLVVPVCDKFSAYSRFGLSLPLTRKAFIKEEYKGVAPLWDSYNDELETELTSYFSIAYSAAIGLNYKLNDHLGLFFEVNGLLSSFTAKKLTVTKYIVDGEDKLSSMDMDEKEIEFYKEYNSNNNPNDSDKPGQQPSFSLSNSSIGLMLGLSFKF